MVAQPGDDRADQPVGLHSGQRDDLVVGAALRAGEQHGQVPAHIDVQLQRAAPLRNLGHANKNGLLHGICNLPVRVTSLCNPTAHR